MFSLGLSLDIRQDSEGCPPGLGHGLDLPRPSSETLYSRSEGPYPGSLMSPVMFDHRVLKNVSRHDNQTGRHQCDTRRSNNTFFLGDQRLGRRNGCDEKSTVYDGRTTTRRKSPLTGVPPSFPYDLSVLTRVSNKIV